MADWANRIVEHGEASPGDLVPNPKNWRQHPPAQAKALTAVLDKIGWVQDVIVNRTTGHLVDGHLRAGLAVSQGVEAIPVSYVELDTQEEALALASLDPLGLLAVRDDAALIGLLADLEGAGDEFGGLVSWLRVDKAPPTLPSQNQIDRTNDEMLNRFRDGPDGTGIEVKCPECGEEFGLAGIGVTS